MQKQSDFKVTTKKLITTRTLFTVSIFVIILTVLAIWLFGLGQHRTIFINSILSTTILSTAFFLFLSVGLYKGIKLKDDIGKITDKIKVDDIPILSNGLDFPSEIPGIEEGILGAIFGIILWIIISVFILFFLWVFGAIVSAMVLVFIAMLYWIFFRALRLVFKNSNKCKGDLKTSILYGIGYTTLYNFWIYSMILATHYLIK